MRSPNCSPPEPATRPPVVNRHALRSTPTESTVACTGCGVHRVREHQVLIAHRLQGVGGGRVLGVRDHVHREPDGAASDARRRCDGGVPRPVLQRGEQRAPDLVQREGVGGQICPVHGRGGIRYGMEGAGPQVEFAGNPADRRTVSAVDTALTPPVERRELGVDGLSMLVRADRAGDSLASEARFCQEQWRTTVDRGAESPLRSVPCRAVARSLPAPRDRPPRCPWPRWSEPPDISRTPAFARTPAAT